MRVRRRSLLLVLLLLAIGLFDGFLLLRRARYREESTRLRAGMSTLERTRADAIVSAQADRAELMLELMRRQAEGDDALHLAVSTDSAYLALDRGAARLREIKALIGPERRVGLAPDTVHVVIPRGVRAVQRLLTTSDRYELPAWVWIDRGLPVPAVRADSGWVGRGAIVTSGGTLIYALPASGPLADSTYVMPGSIRVPAVDLAAIRENLSPGMRVYFF
ncbi:hypothetical protein [Gemmatimonas groenlandica]|uniref:Uncharacterized protein n=1 Tax=Gemmatimonas groenlandica TaxID=2732249 RepID=A0A6M4IHY3_9BACT|nr:hypothetical protein [Gemmatimonas groenlandica]QJR34413.1 hypothetical protein HKW67_02185 [Gemmatimonas groenlandica]